MLKRILQSKNCNILLFISLQQTYRFWQNLCIFSNGSVKLQIQILCIAVGHTADKIIYKHKP